MAPACARAIALLVLVWTARATPRLEIELTPKGPLRLEVVAAERDSAASLGRSLAQSLGCTLSGAAEDAAGDEHSFRADCAGSFQRHGQTLEGTLHFSAFRAPLRALHIASLSVDVAMPNTPYRNTGFSRNWERTVEDGAVHYRRVVTPGQLPATVPLALGYRPRELEMMLAPAGVAVLAALALMAALQFLVKQNYRRNLTLGLAAIFLAWATACAILSKVFGGDYEAWALYTTWHGWSAILGKEIAMLLCCLPVLVVTAVVVRWRPADWSAILLAALGWIVPAYWTIAAFGSLTIGDPLNCILRLGLAAGLAVLLRYLAQRYGAPACELRRPLALFGGLTAGMVLTHLVRVNRAALAAPLTMAVAAAVVVGLEWWLSVRTGRAAPAASDNAELEAFPTS